MDSSVCIEHVCVCWAKMGGQGVAVSDFRLLEGSPKCSHVQIWVFKAVSSPCCFSKMFYFYLKVTVLYLITWVILHPN